jgi:hypothetical protein
MRATALKMGMSAPQTSGFERLKQRLIKHHFRSIETTLD